MGKFRTSRTFDVIFIALLGGLLWWAAAHRTSVGDWIYFLSYHPSSATVQAADDAGLSPLGRRLLYRTNPQFGSKAAVAAACDIERLGCIDSKGLVFILDDPGQHAQTVVTAAHEMLHLAYRRLTPTRRDELAPLIDQAIAAHATDGLGDELKDQQTPEDRRDEAHSLLGTEYRDLPAGLEDYYGMYFSDRSKVLASEAESQR